jgi:hypothetical protein
MAFSLQVHSQNYGEFWTVELVATVQDSPEQIILSWEDNQHAGDTYRIRRKIKGALGWGAPIATLSSSTLSYADTNVTSMVAYEYEVQKLSSGILMAWGYVSAGIRTEIAADKGDLLLLVDSTFVTSLSTETEVLIKDLEADGWHVTKDYVARTATVPDVKDKIVSYYGSLPNLQTLYLLGHIPVPYSGNLNPDAHPDHEGAWPADVFYGDVDGGWTDVYVNNSVAADSRNHNVPGDGKFDQSKVPSKIELEVGRVDFANLPAFTESEEDLLRNYLNKAHEFKTAQYIPLERGLVDEGDFGTFNEGFWQNGYRNFVPMFSKSLVYDADYTTSLSSSYLWSYGCGAGSHTSVAAIDGGTALTTSELSTIDLQSTFTMLFGSYFGDWDRDNNLLRAALASGRTLASVWAGRPNWHFHTMASGDHIGISAKMSQDKDSYYSSLNLGGGFVTAEGVHVALMGDPSIRLYYESAPSNLSIVNNSNLAELAWTASSDPTIDGYNVYRRDNGIWSKLNDTIITALFYTDSPPVAGTWSYMVKSVKLKTNSSGTFYNESLGIIGEEMFSVGLPDTDQLEVQIFPNPAQEYVNIVSNQRTRFRTSMYSLEGRLVKSTQWVTGSLTLNLEQIAKGIYVIKIESENGFSKTNKIIVN